MNVGGGGGGGGTLLKLFSAGTGGGGGVLKTSPKGTFSLDAFCSFAAKGSKVAFSFEGDSMEDSPSKGKGGGATEESFGFSGVVFSKGLNVGGGGGGAGVGGIESTSNGVSTSFSGLIGGAGGSSPKGLNAGGGGGGAGAGGIESLSNGVPISFSGLIGGAGVHLKRIKCRRVEEEPGPVELNLFRTAYRFHFQG